MVFLVGFNPSEKYDGKIMFQTTNQDLFTMCIYKLTYDLVNVWVDEIGYKLHIPSGKRLHNYGKSPCVIGILTMNGHFQVRKL